MFSEAWQMLTVKTKLLIINIPPVCGLPSQKTFTILSAEGFHTFPASFFVYMECKSYVVSADRCNLNFSNQPMPAEWAIAMVTRDWLTRYISMRKKGCVTPWLGKYLESFSSPSNTWSIHAAAVPVTMMSWSFFCCDSSFVTARKWVWNVTY